MGRPQEILFPGAGLRDCLCGEHVSLESSMKSSLSSVLLPQGGLWHEHAVKDWPQPLGRWRVY